MTNHKGEEQLELIRNFYDNVYYRDVDPGKDPSRHLRRLAKSLNVTSGQRVLDVGCGLGRWLAAAAERGATIAGIDLSDRAIQICRRRSPSGEFHCGTAERLPFPDESFDLVTCLGSLEHFVDPGSALTEMVRVAKKRARILLLVPNSGFLTRRLGLYRGTQQVDAKEDVRSIDEWETLFRQSGLVVVNRWNDLHVLSAKWVMNAPWWQVPIRLAQALALAIWPLSWQYQIYFDCQKSA